MIGLLRRGFTPSVRRIDWCAHGVGGSAIREVMRYQTVFLLCRGKGYAVWYELPPDTRPAMNETCLRRERSPKFQSSFNLVRGISDAQAGP